jgi:hypothetical protein
MVMDYLKLFVVFCLFVVVILVVNLKIHAPHAYFIFVLSDGLIVVVEAVCSLISWTIWPQRDTELSGHEKFCIGQSL